MNPEEKNKMDMENKKIEHENYIMNQENLLGKKGVSSKDKVIGTIFIIWFLASMIGMFVFTKYSIMIFGQYFLVFGAMATRVKGDGKWISIPFLIVGLGCIVIPYLMMNPDILKVEIIWDSVIPLLFILIFVLVGLAMVIIPIMKKKNLKKRCIVPVFATIVKYKETYGESSTLYAPVYSYEYDNQKYEVSTNTYSNIGVKPVGTIVDLQINPYNPKEFLDNNVVHKGIIVMGILFLLVSIPIFIYLITTFQFIK